MSTMDSRRGRCAGRKGALGAPLALAVGVSLAAPVSLVVAGSTTGRAAAQPPGAEAGSDPQAVDGGMVTGPVDDPVLDPRLAEHMQLAASPGPPYACTASAPATTSTAGTSTTTSTSTTSSTTTSSTTTTVRATTTSVRPTTTVHTTTTVRATSTTAARATSTTAAAASSSTTGPAPTTTLPPGASTTSSTLARETGAEPLRPAVVATSTSIPSQATSSSAPVTTYSPTSTATPVVVPGERLGYDLLESNGLVATFGGAGEYGPKRALAHGAVGEAVTADGAGYWILAADGTVTNFGDAIAYGEPRHLVTGRTVAIAATPDGGGYWILTSKGGIDNFGDAPFCGSAVHDPGSGAFVAIAPLPDGSGYWLVTAEGDVKAYGDASVLPASGNSASVAAGALGAPGGLADTVAIAATPDGKGYWLLGSGGSVHAFGDARYYGGGSAKKGVGTFVSIATTPDGNGYWLATSKGRVFQFGDATADGSLAHRHLAKGLQVVGLSAAVLPPASSTAPGGPTGTGTTTTAPNSTTTLPGSSTTLSAPGSSAPGSSAPVRSTPSTTSTPRRSTPTTTVARRSPTTTTVPHAPPAGSTATKAPSGKFGYDISNFQCARPGSSAVRSNLPTTSDISIVQVAGWLDSGENPCVGAEAAWATRAAPKGDHYELYLFMNSPGTNTVALDQAAKGPAGTCGDLQPSARPSCLAYNYGYNGAISAVAYAASHNVQAHTWWLDIENDSLSHNDYSNFAGGQYWSASTALNDRTISGALTALRRAGLVVGIYSTSVQYPRIAGNFVPSGARIPLWIAGVPWTSPPFTEHDLYTPSALGPWCAGKAGYAGYRGGELFAGGAVQLLQETPGTEPSPYGLDPDYAC
jgi:hypothetical protein